MSNLTEINKNIHMTASSLVLPLVERGFYHEKFCIKVQQNEDQELLSSAHYCEPNRPKHTLTSEETPQLLALY